MYIRMPKKFIDFHRSSRPADDDKAEEGEDAKQRKTLRRRKENAPSYKLDNEFIWKVRVDGDGEQSDRDPNVILDTPEPLRISSTLFSACRQVWPDSSTTARMPCSPTPSSRIFVTTRGPRYASPRRVRRKREDGSHTPSRLLVEEERD